MSNIPLQVNRVVVAIGATYAACHALFLFVQFGLRGCSTPWQNGFHKNLAVTHVVVFLMASFQHVLRAFVLHHDDENDNGKGEDHYSWDARLILLYYESCVLSFLVILVEKLCVVWITGTSHHPQEVCDETVNAVDSLNEDDYDDISDNGDVPA